MATSTHLSYQVLTDRARPFVGLVRLTLTPRWTGTATVTDEIDGTPANLTTQVDKGWAAGAHRDWVSVTTEGTNIVAALSSQLQSSANVMGAFSQVDQSLDQSVGQQVSFPVSSGHNYTLTKYVGIASSQTSGNAATAAEARPAARRVPVMVLFSVPAARVVVAVARPDRHTGKSGPGHRCQRQRVLPVVEHRGPASTGASLRPGSRPTDTTGISSGMPRPGCSPRCWRSTPTWRRG